jgi:hypothetical protein
VSSKGSEAEVCCEENEGGLGSGMLSGSPRRRAAREDIEDDDEEPDVVLILGGGGNAKLRECDISVLSSCMAGECTGELYESDDPPEEIEDAEC